MTNAQRVSQIASTLSAPNCPSYPPILAGPITYTAFGGITTLTDGCTCGAGCCTRFIENYDYNKRLQPVRTQVGNWASTAA